MNKLSKEVIHQHARKIIDNNDIVFAIDFLMEVSDKRELRLYRNFFRREIKRIYGFIEPIQQKYLDRLNYAHNFSRTRSPKTLGREWNPPSVIY